MLENFRVAILKYSWVLQTGDFSAGGLYPVSRYLIFKVENFPLMGLFNNIFMDLPYSELISRQIFC